MNAECYVCHLNRYTGTARALAGDAAADRVARELMERYLQAPAHMGSPYFGPAVTELLEKYCGLTGDRFAEEKEMSNRFVLERLDHIRAMIASAPDPVFAGLQFSILGNYLGSRCFTSKGASIARPIILLVLIVFFIRTALEMMGIM